MVGETDPVIYVILHLWRFGVGSCDLKARCSTKSVARVKHRAAAEPTCMLKS